MSTDIVPREKLTKQGVTGLVSVAGGVGALVLNVIDKGVVGMIVGGAITVAGLLLSGSRHERTAGVVTTVVGAATLAASVGILGGLVHGVLVAGGIVLLGVGAYSLFRFVRGLKTRA
jgi:hypothetical protein